MRIKISYAASFSWNQLQNALKLKELVSLNRFKSFLNDVEAGSSVRTCFVLTVTVTLCSLLFY